MASVFVPKNAQLATLLRGSGAITGPMEGLINGAAICADPSSGANCSWSDFGPGVKVALQALYNANTGNPAAPQLLAIINQMG